MCRSIITGILLVYFTACALAQPNTNINSITVSVSKTDALPLDQIYVNLDVTAPITVSLTDVVKMLQPIGIQITELTIAASAYAATPPYSSWSFSTVRPVSASSSLVATLSNLQTTFKNAGPSYSFTFSLGGPTSSVQSAQKYQCSYPDLVTSAKSKAQAIATASGRVISGLLALATTVDSTTPSTCSVTATFSVVGF